MKADQPPQPNREPEWSELEKDPRFERTLVTYLVTLLIEKKYGADFYEQYEHQDVLRTLEEVKLGVDTGPLIPEIQTFITKAHKTKSLQEIIDLAKQEGLEFTDQEIQEQKAFALEFLVNEDGK